MNSSSFEKSLCEAIKRLSKGNFEDSIREVVGHYDDIYDEAVAKGIAPAQAIKLANGRIGLIGNIARKIVDSPARVKQGIQIQVAGVLLWFLIPTLVELSWYVLAQLPYSVEHVIFGLLPRLYHTIFLGGVITAFGWFRSSRANWKTIGIGAACLLLMGIRLYFLMGAQPDTHNAGEIAVGIIFSRFLAYVLGVLVGATLLRLYLYRFESLKLRRT